MIFFIDMWFSKWTYIVIAILLALIGVGLIIAGGLTNWAGWLTGTGGSWSWQYNFTQKAGLCCCAASAILSVIIYLLLTYAFTGPSKKSKKHHDQDYDDGEGYGESGYEDSSGYYPQQNYAY